jgi:hypothetical protein
LACWYAVQRLGFEVDVSVSGVFCISGLGVCVWF